MRVLQIVDTLGMGGAETWLIELLRKWSRTGEVQCDFLMTSGQRGLFDDEAKSLGARLYYQRYGRDRALTFAREYRKILAQGRYDAIHDHSDFSSGWRYLMGLGLLPPVRVTHIHNPTYQIRNNHGVTAMRRFAGGTGRRLVAQLATYIAATSRQVLGEYGFDAPLFARLPKAAIYCGFDPARFSGSPQAEKAALSRRMNWPQTARVILFVGRIDQSPDLGAPQNHKNSGFAVDVAIAAAQADPSIHAVFAGAPSPASAILQQRIAEARLEDRIKLVGIERNIEHLMLASDVLLFPSRAEGLGMVAVEAQAAGLPVLASTGVPSECVVDGALVRFLDVAAGVPAWAEAISESLARQRDVAAANRRVAASGFSIEASANALTAVYAARSVA